MHRSSSVRFVPRLALAAVLGVTAGCGGGGGSIQTVGDPVPLESTDTTIDDGADPGGIIPTSPGIDTDVCTLLTQPDLAGLADLGWEVTLGDGADDASDVLSDVPSGSCGWSMSSTTADGQSISWTFRIVVERGTDSGGFEEVAADSFMDTEPEVVDGLGDAATYQQDQFLDGPELENRIAVLSGTDVIVITNLEERVIPKDSLIELARIVTDRLAAT